MKNFKTSLILLMLLAGCNHSNIVTALSSGIAPEKVKNYKVAIVSSLRTPESIAFSDMLATEMLGIGFRVIERNRIEAALQEQKLSLSGLLEKSDYDTLSKIANLDAVFIYLAKYDGERINSCVFKLIDVKTGEVLLSTNYKASSGADMLTVASSIGRSMNAQLGRI